MFRLPLWEGCDRRQALVGRTHATSDAHTGLDPAADLIIVKTSQNCHIVTACATNQTNA